MTVSFHKMHGLGNDFVIIDTRKSKISLAEDKICALADRYTGIGFDQLILLVAPENKDVDVSMRIYNCDGSPSGACGNATRCVARLLLDNSGHDQCRIETSAGVLTATGTDGIYTVNLGRPKLTWKDIPLDHDVDTLALDIHAGPLVNPCAVSLGNPHAVFFVPDVGAVDLETYGPQIENNPIFPEKTNVEVVHIVDEKTLRMRVWERGCGITSACGSGAGAAVVAAHRRDFIGRQAMVELDGGVLTFNWDIDSGDLYMVGPAEHVYTGTVAL